LRQERPHIVQSYLFWANIYGSLAAKIAEVPIIVTGRRELPDISLVKFHYRWLQNFSNLWTTAIIANSHTVKRLCLEQERYVDEKKVTVIYNGIDLTRYANHAGNTDKKRAFHIPPHHHVIGIIARLRRYKGHLDFLNAAAQILRSYPNTTFLLVGRDDGLKPELECLAKQLHLSESVIFTGERHDIPDMLSMCDILVSSSLTEGLSNAILEGMALGKAVVATNVGGTPELVIHEQTGLLVPPSTPTLLAEAIIRLLANPELRSRLGHAGLKRVETLFDLKRMVHQTETCYEELFRKYHEKNRLSA
jgi:glycosyltransferase involved in cell wall biosynthesis